jgi:hypothetical protein
MLPNKLFMCSPHVFLLYYDIFFLAQCSLTLFPNFVILQIFHGPIYCKSFCEGYIYSLSLYRYAKWRDHTILCLECVESLEITICEGPIQETHGQKMV